MGPHFSIVAYNSLQQSYNFNMTNEKSFDSMFLEIKRPLSFSVSGSDSSPFSSTCGTELAVPGGAALGSMSGMFIEIVQFRWWSDHADAAFEGISTGCVSSAVCARTSHLGTNQSLSKRSTPSSKTWLIVDWSCHL
jgi:hypothetical protein